MSDKKLSITERMKQEPLIPVGILATIGALTYATWGVIKRNHTVTQNGMRGRVLFQGLTIAALVYYSMQHSKSVEDKSERSHQQDVRQIDWEKLEREAEEIQKIEAARTGPRRDPAIERLAAFAKEKKAKSIFSEDS